MSKPGTLYLIPVTLGNNDTAAVLPDGTLQIVRTLRHFIVENAKSARAFLKAAAYAHPLQSTSMQVLDEHTRPDDVAALLKPLIDGNDCGLMSEAGCPGVADPGAALVRAAHIAGIRVMPLTGPSAILLALMASGFNGQRFTFHGYLPADKTPRAGKLKELEKISERDDATQIFIEAPYRNDAMLDAITTHCAPDTLLCVATELTNTGETIRTMPVAAWKKIINKINNLNTVFLLYRPKN